MLPHLPRCLNQDKGYPDFGYHLFVWPKYFDYCAPCSKANDQLVGVCMSFVVLIKGLASVPCAPHFNIYRQNMDNEATNLLMLMSHY